MSKNKPLEKSIRDNLYGIPLDDILTPEELLELERKHKEAVFAKSKEREKSKKIVFKPNKKMCVAAICILAGILFLVLIKNPLLARIASRIYVTEAIEETVKKAKDEAEEISKFLFGFDVFDANNINMSVSADSFEDSLDKLTDVSFDIITDVSFNSKEAVGVWNLRKSNESILNLAAYLNDFQAGVNLGNFFSEYWTLPTKGFGKKWNKSGLKSVLYAQQTDDNCDISFSNIFSGEFVSEQTSRQIEKIVNGLLVSGKTKYMGKEEVPSGDKNLKTRKIAFIFSPQQLQSSLVPIAEAVLLDSKFQSISDLPGKEEFANRIEQGCEKLINNIVFDRDVCVYFFEYKGRIVRICTEVGYTENMNNTKFVFDLTFADKKNVLNSISIYIYTGNGADTYAYNLISWGNRGLKGKQFTDNTELNEITANYRRSITNGLVIDYKNNTVTGNILKTDGEAVTDVSYSGTISKKRSAEVVLDNISVNSINKGVRRKVLSEAGISILPKTVNKISVGSKKDILDLDKFEAETYVKKIVETENFKKADDYLKEIFGN